MKILYLLKVILLASNRGRGDDMASGGLIENPWLLGPFEPEPSPWHDGAFADSLEPTPSPLLVGAFVDPLEADPSPLKLYIENSFLRGDGIWDGKSNSFGS